MRLSEAGFVLTSQELLFLANLTGSEFLMGFNSEDAISTSKEAEDIWQRIEPELRKKNYVVDEADGLKTFDTSLMKNINLCAAPACFISCKSSINGNEANCFFYFRDGQYAQLERDTSMDNSYILTPLHSLSRLSMNLQDHMDYNEDFSAMNCRIALSAEDVRKLMDADLPDLKQEPFAEGLNDELLADLVEAFCDRSNSRTLLVMGFRESLGIISEILTFRGRKWLWRLSRTEEEDKFICSAVDSDTYMDSLKELIMAIPARVGEQSSEN